MSQDLRSHEYLARELDEARARIEELEKALRWIADYTKPGPTQTEYDAVIHAVALSGAVRGEPGGDVLFEERDDE